MLNKKLKPKVKVTSVIRDSIQELRLRRGITGVELSKELNKSEGWISLIENGRILTTKDIDLINMFSILLKVSESDAEEYIVNNLIIEEEESNQNYLNRKEKFSFENEYDTNLEDELFEEVVESINEGFRFAYNKKKKYTFANLEEFKNNINFDLSFMLGVISLPFHELKELKGIDVRVKKKLFSDIEKVVRKYIEKYQNADDNLD